MRTVELTKESTRRIFSKIFSKEARTITGNMKPQLMRSLENVKEKGDEALFAYTKKFDKTEVTDRNHPRYRGRDQRSL